MKATKQIMRSFNKQAILNLFIGKESLDISEIVRKTNLCAATVSKQISELMKEGLILEKSTGKSCGGRRPMLYCLNGERAYALSVRITPKGATVAIVNFNCSIVYSKTAAQIIYGFARVRELMGLLVKSLQEEHNDLFVKIRAVAFSIPGILNYTKNAVLYSAPLGLENFNIAEMVNEIFPFTVRTYIFKDTDALILGEYNFSSFPPRQSMAYILCEYGVGMSLILKGELFRHDGSSLELGHTTIDMNGKQTRPNHIPGALGALLSEMPAVRRYLDLYEQSHSDFIDPYMLDYNDIVNLYIEKDGIARQVLSEQFRYLTIAIVNVVNLFNPDTVIIGGSLARLPECIEQVSADVKLQVLKPFAAGLNIYASSFSLSACLLGMASYVFQTEFFKLVQI